MRRQVNRALLAAGWCRSLQGTRSWRLLVRVGWAARLPRYREREARDDGELRAALVEDCSVVGARAPLPERLAGPAVLGGGGSGCEISPAEAGAGAGPDVCGERAGGPIGVLRQHPDQAPL